MKEMLKNISPFNNRADMGLALFIFKKVLAFWFCYIAGLLIAEGAVILLHFALGKNMLVGDVFDSQTITLIIYYGYVIVISVILLYWKLVEKKSLSEIGLTKHVGSYFVGVIIAVVTLSIIIEMIILKGAIEYRGIFERRNILLLLLLGGGFIIQGAMEELLCRGFLFHTLISLIFSLLTIRYQSIWAACGLHSFWNLILSGILGLHVSGNDENTTAILHMQSVGSNIWNGGIYGIEASVLTTFVLGIISILLWTYGKRVKTKI